MSLDDRDWYREAIKERDRALKQSSQSNQWNQGNQTAGPKLVIPRFNLKRTIAKITNELALTAGAGIIFYFLYMLVKIIQRFTVGH